jgi:hypothetical protein
VTSSQEDDLVRVGIYVTPEQRRWLRQQAVNLDTNTSALVRGMLDAAITGAAIAVQRRRNPGHGDSEDRP